jgi:prolyl 4-hydroxylase
MWKRLGQSVAAGPWHVAPERRELSADPSIVSFPGLLSPTLCDWLIEQATPRLEPARVNETHTNSAAKFSLIDVTFAHLLIQARMAVSCGMPIQHMEPSTVLHYRPGQEFPSHYDFVDPELPDYAQEIARNGQRTLTFFAYLNDDYEGGETDFSELGVRHKGTRGEGLYFVNAFPDGRPDMRMKHAGLAPTRGDKWVLSQFVRSQVLGPNAHSA